jgi:glycosyltransferase involved in cell wall biosynthesis|tara:strand:+ start:1173 stop:2312 length:1140 start_codon:yes stop_codon:yes gene_type:complete
LESNKKKIFYWSPSLVNIATNKAVINSAYAMSKYNKEFECCIINFFGEFERYKSIILEKKIKLIYCFNKSLINCFPKHGKFKSRFSFFIIFIMSFFPLKNLIKKKSPDYLIIHLITSLPLLLLLLFNFKTKFILRISGLPNLNFFRKFLWKLAFKKIYKVTCPTINTYNYIKKLNIISDEKIHILYDPVINIKEINIKKKQLNLEFKDYFLAVGRLTKQKNFLFLCKAFKKKIEENNNIKLMIAGEGEEKKSIMNYIVSNNLEKNIILLNHIDNIFPYFKNAKAFILTSLWEDPGFVLIEAAFCRTLVLSNDSEPGPKELVKDNYNGIVFKKNNVQSFHEKLDLIIKQKEFDVLKFNNFKNVKKFTIFNHFNYLTKILS